MIVLLLKTIRWLLTVLLFVAVGPWGKRPLKWPNRNALVGWHRSGRQRFHGLFRILERLIARISRAVPSFWRIMGALLAALTVLTLLFAVWQPFLRDLRGMSATSIQVDTGTLAALMALIVALLSLGIGAFGWFTYQLLRSSIKEVAGQEGQVQKYTILSKLQHSCWLMYKPHLPKGRTEEMKYDWVGLVDAATAMARMALAVATSEFNEKTILSASNNLAYHIATKGSRASDEEKHEGLRLAHRIFRGAARHDQYGWKETYVWVLWRLGGDNLNEKKAKRVMSALVRNAQVPQAQRDEWKKRYTDLLS